ncbi:hypothetical protein [Parabacteroides sp. PF5-9]|uniref:hypothetical protein n=1 Tax=Parabacteroides sp. PF5-9 TaxID=1742404 RepID=UPI002475B476|nr:hypothetical protein [Parabacteroides sp. PF5-9]MDH6356649.1 hypothetical protein [Parabacteroides sp. PF5-9]
MKRFLLLLCLLPCLSFAQTEKKQKPKTLKWFQSGTSATPLLRAQESILLDSVYTFTKTDEENPEILEQKTYYKYDEFQRITEELLFVDYSGLEQFRQYKSIYTYKNSSRYPSRIETYYLKNGNWMKISEDQQNYTEEGIPLEARSFVFDGEGLKLENVWKAISFDEKGIPTEFIDSTFYEEVYVMKFNITFNEKAQPTAVTTFSPNEINREEWIPFEKMIYHLDEEGLLRLKEEHYDYEGDEDWDFSYLIAYEYDERGRMIHENEAMGPGMFYSFISTRNFYSDGLTTHNEPPVTAATTATIHYTQGSGSLYVDLMQEQSGHLLIMRPTGRLVGQYRLNQQTTTIPLNTVKGEVLIVRLQTKSGHYTKKILVR